MPTKEFVKSIRGFKGLNTQSPARLIDDNELVTCRNYFVGNDGALIKRPGLLSLDTTHTGPIALHGPFRPNGTSGQLRFFISLPGTSTTVYHTQDGITWTALATALGNVNWATNLGELVFLGSRTAGVDQYSGATNALTDLVSAPNGYDGIIFKQRMFVIEDLGNSLPGRLRFSEPYGASVGGLFTGAAAWPATNTVDVETGTESDFIVALAIIHDTLYIFKRRSIWALYVQGTSVGDWVLRKINNSIGCVHKRGVLQIDNFFYFRGDSGVYRTDGTSFQELSENVKNDIRLPDDYFRSMPGFTGNQGPLKYKDWIIFLLYEKTDVTGWALNYRTGAWSRLTFVGTLDQFTSGLNVQDGSTAMEAGFYLSALGTGAPFRRLFAMHEDEANDPDAGVAFEAHFQTKEFDFDLFDRFKRIKWLEVDATSAGDLQIGYVTESLTPASTTVTLNNSAVARVAGPGACRLLSVQVDDNSETNRHSILGVHVHGSFQSKVSSQVTL